MRVGASFTKRGAHPYVSTTLNPRRKQQKLSEGEAIAFVVMVILAFVLSWWLVTALFGSIQPGSM